MQGRPLLFVDVETTGGMAYNSRILEIGALRVEGGQIVASMNQVLDPEEPVPSWITRLTGIELHETAGQPLFSDIMPRFRQLLDGALFIAHNVNFDYGFFREEYRRADSFFSADKLCTVRLSRALYPDQRSHRLDAVIARHGYQVANRHRAYDDAEVLYKFYRDSLDTFGADYVEPIARQLIQPDRSFIM